MDWDLNQLGEVKKTSGIKRYLFALRHDHNTYVVHRDDDGKGDYMLLFESVIDAAKVLDEYREATKCDALVCTFDAHDLDLDFNVRLYRIDGTWADYSRNRYMRMLKLRERFEQAESSID
jgi:hypothetical protein